VSGAADIVDLWSEVIGQAPAIGQLQAAVRSPVHAYLLVGPSGSGKRAAARAFAADLLSEGQDAAGTDRTRRLAAAEAHPSLFIVEREGESIDAKQADEVVRRSSLAPPEGNRQVIVLVDFHLVTVAGPKLLKSIEEPPPSTFFVVLVEELPPEMETIASRCVRVDLSGVPASAIAERLAAEGFDSEVAEAAAGAAGGSIARARLLARDPGVRARRESWYRAPERLDGTGHAVSVAVDELLEAVEGVLEPLAAQQSEELERFVAGFESAGLQVPKGQLQAIEKRHKREQRKVRMDELKSGLAVLVGRYRDAVRDGGSAEDFVAVADEVQAVCDALTFNPRESLALQALFVSLPRLP
jgi:DNA polymerase III subunit delta'